MQFEFSFFVPLPCDQTVSQFCESFQFIVLNGFGILENLAFKVFIEITLDLGVLYTDSPLFDHLTIETELKLLRSSLDNIDNLL